MSEFVMSEDERSASIAPVKYVALGDSTGVGVGAQTGGGYVARLFTRIARLHENAEVTNLCVSGSTTVDVLREQTPQAANLKPTLVTLGIGINDINRGIGFEEFAGNYARIIAKLKEVKSKESAKAVPIVVVNIPDISLAPRVPVYARTEISRRIQSFNNQIKGIAEADKLRLVDIYHRSHETLREHPEFFSEDGFHPSEAGYEYWAKMMWPVVEQAIKEHEKEAL